MRAPRRPLLGMSAEFAAVTVLVSRPVAPSIPGLAGVRREPLRDSPAGWLARHGLEADTEGHDGVVDAGEVHQPA
jgi:hypothetical protein